jgi:hypothetical protein
MRRTRVAVLGLAVVGLALVGGCLSDDGSSDENRLETAQATEDTGGLEGLVTDPAIEPIEGAQVRLPQLDASTTTAEDGSFAFSELEPGSYTLVANATGHQASERTVDVVAGEVRAVDLVLAQRNVQEPYRQTFELAGFFECGFAAGASTEPAPPPANTSQGLISSPTCATVNSLSGNATNDRFDHYFGIEPNVETMVVETEWEPSAGSLSDQLWVDVVPEGHHCGSITMCNWSLLDHWGESTLVGRVNSERFEHVQQHFDDRCEEGEDEACGLDFAEEGWPLWIRVYPRWECQPAGAQACVLLQQDFRHVVTSFHHEPAPEGYTALS